MQEVNALPADLQRSLLRAPSPCERKAGARSPGFRGSSSGFEAQRRLHSVRVQPNAPPACQRTEDGEDAEDAEDGFYKRDVATPPDRRKKKQN